MLNDATLEIPNYFPDKELLYSRRSEKNVKYPLGLLLSVLGLPTYLSKPQSTNLETK